MIYFDANNWNSNHSVIFLINVFLACSGIWEKYFRNQTSKQNAFLFRKIWEIFCLCNRSTTILRRFSGALSNPGQDQIVFLYILPNFVLLCEQNHIFLFDWTAQPIISFIIKCYKMWNNCLQSTMKCCWQERVATAWPNN